MLEPRHVLSKRRDLKQCLDAVGNDPKRCFEDSAQLLLEMFHASYGMIIKPTRLSTGYGPELFYHSGMTGAQTAGITALFTAGRPIFAYNPDDPEPGQRNRFVVPGHDMGVNREKVREADVYFRRLGSSSFHQQRVLICDGSRFLAWVGVLRENPPTGRERRAWTSLIPYLVQALRVERALRDGALATAGLSCALDCLEGLWFVTSKTGRVLHANAVAQRVINVAPKETQAQVINAIQQRNSSPGGLADVTELRNAGDVGGFLVRLRVPSSPTTRLELAAKMWNLTARQVKTLAFVANGDSNTDIAHKLGCAQRTVEAHVTALLRGSKSSGRAELVAKFWTLS